jgi:pyridoxine 4-dehydrogenase
MSQTAARRPGGTFSLAGRPVGRIGLGVMQLPGAGGRAAPPRAQALDVLRRAIELGVNHLDTAQFYGNGLANELIRAALAPFSDDLVLVTKVGAAEGSSGKLQPAQRPDELRRAVEDNLATLGVDRVDVVNLRRLDGPPGIVAHGDQRVDLESQLVELVSLRDEGKIGGIGLSNVTLQQLEAALPVGIVCVQNTYNLLDRAEEPMLDLCHRHVIGWAPYFPLGSAFPGRPKVTDDPTVIATAQRLEATPAQIGLGWLLAHNPVVLTIPGTTSIEHLEENVTTVALDDQALVDLDSLAPAPVPDADASA